MATIKRSWTISRSEDTNYGVNKYSKYRSTAKDKATIDERTHELLLRLQWLASEQVKSDESMFESGFY